MAQPQNALVGKEGAGAPHNEKQALREHFVTLYLWATGVPFGLVLENTGVNLVRFLSYLVPVSAPAGTLCVL